MARKPKKPAPRIEVLSETLGPPIESDLLDGDLPAPRTEPGFRLESRPVVGAVPLVTIGPGHHAWDRTPFDVDGAIVWVAPPEGVPEEEVRRVAEVAAGTGALAVRVDRGRKALVALPLREKRPHARHRDVVVALARAANVPDREKLVAFVELVMERVGVS